MGIKGFTTFIQETPEVFKEVKLCDRKVLFDGNNLFYYIFSEYHVNHMFGGNYNQFARVTKSFFEALKKCNIEALVIFDGGNNPDDKKLKTILQRVKDKIHNCASISRGGRGTSLPILSQLVFRNVLNEIGVKHVTSDFEADDQLAALANQLDCIVISNDSDFFIFPLNEGFIRLDLFDIQIKTDPDGHCYLKGWLYKPEFFLRHFKVKTLGMLPMIGAIMGNDLDDGHIFGKFFESIKGEKKHGKRQKFQTAASARRCRKLIGLLNWLQDLNTVDEAVNKMLEHIGKEKRSQATKIVMDTVERYTNINCNLEPFLRSDFSVVPLIYDYYQNSIPEWLCVLIHRGDVSFIFVNILVQHRVILSCQVEDITQSSSYDITNDLRLVLYSILVPELFSKGSDITLKGREKGIEEISRDNKNIKRTLKCDAFKGNIELPTLSDIPSLNIEKKKSLMVLILESENFSFAEFPPESELVLRAVIYWANHANSGMTLNYIRAFIICWIKLTFFDKNVSNETAKNTFSISDEVTADEKEVINTKLMKFVHPNDPRSHNRNDPKVMHIFAQLQAVLLFIHYLNQILCYPYPCIHPEAYFNGVFLFNFVQELSNRTQPEEYISSLVGRTSSVYALYKHLLDTVIKAVDVNKLECPEISKKQTRKRNKAAKTRTAKAISTDSEQETDSDDKKERHVTIKASCELNNRFDALLLSD